MSTDHAARTRNLLTTSKIFEHLMSKFDVLKIADAGVIDMSKWSLETHLLVRAWSSSTNFDQPPPVEIQQYIDSI